LEKDLKENAKSFFENLKKTYKFIFNENKTEIEVIVPNEIYYILKKDLSTICINEKEFFDE